MRSGSNAGHGFSMIGLCDCRDCRIASCDCVLVGFFLVRPQFVRWHGASKAVHCCRPLAPGSYNITAVLKGYGEVSAGVTVPADGSGAQYNFALPCTTCETVHKGVAWDKAYAAEVGRSYQCNYQCN